MVSCPSHSSSESEDWHFDATFLRSVEYSRGLLEPGLSLAVDAVEGLHWRAIFQHRPLCPILRQVAEADFSVALKYAQSGDLEVGMVSPAA